MDKGGGNAIGRLLLTIIDLATKTNSSASSSFVVPCLTKEGDHGWCRCTKDQPEIFFLLGITIFYNQVDEIDETCLCFITVQSVCLPAAFNFESVIEVFNWANRQTQLTQSMIL